MDHHTAGKRLAEHWALPSSLRDVIWLHAQPASAIPELAHASLIGVVTVARAMSRRLHVGWSGDFSPVPDLAALAADFGLGADEVLATGERVHEAVASRCAAIGLEQVTTDKVLMHSLAMANRSLARTGVALERRARQARGQGRILGAISAFLGEARPEDGVARTLGRVVASAASLMGEGFYGALVQTSARGSWRILQITHDGRVLRDEAIDAPGDLAGLDADLTLESLGLLPWISDYALDAVDVRRVRLMRLGGSEEEGARVVLMHDRPADGLEAGGGPLIAAWWSAVRASVEGERARRLGEELASANRALAHAQDQIAESRAMAHLGKVTAGAAHEMNNPLTIISGRAQLLADSLSGARERSAAAAITSAAQSLSDMISSLNMLASPPTPRPAPVSIGAIVRSAIEQAEQRTGTSGRVRARLARDLPEGVLDRELMTRALAEVVVNALEASGDGIVEVRAQADPGTGRLHVEVEDAGPGLSARALRHAFDPFFSEKPAGRQPGLGLARARQLVELHAGTVALRNNSGVGAICTVSLPLTQPSAGLGLMDAA
jgi:signal transduction histidine kinase